MKPISKDQLIKDFTKETGLDEGLITKIITIYWKELRLLMKELKDSRVVVEGWGTMYIMKDRLQKTIELNKNRLNAIPPTSFSNFAKCKRIEEVVDKLEKLDNTLGNQKRKFDEIKRAKREKRFLEAKFPENSPGSNQLNIQEGQDRSDGT